jgi:hypothetical protein
MSQPKSLSGGNGTLQNCIGQLRTLGDLIDWFGKNQTSAIGTKRDTPAPPLNVRYRG